MVLRFTGHPPEYNATLDTVRIVAELDDGSLMVVSVSGEALADRFGSTIRDAKDRIRAFERNRRTIERKASELYRSGRQPRDGTFRLRTEDF